jgi:hypothetical protein
MGNYLMSVGWNYDGCYMRRSALTGLAIMPVEFEFSS